MKLKCINGEMDTDKMTDIDSAIVEKMSEFFELCKKYNALVFIKVITPSFKSTGAHLFGDSRDKSLALLSEMDETLSLISKGTIRLSANPGGVTADPEKILEDSYGAYKATDISVLEEGEKSMGNYLTEDEFAKKCFDEVGFAKKWLKLE